MCTGCHKTFSATKGTAFYRLRTSAETVSLVVTLMAHGCPLQAIVVAFGYDERTVAGWLARDEIQGQAVKPGLCYTVDSGSIGEESGISGEETMPMTCSV